jgi:hypothetical protein
MTNLNMIYLGAISALLIGILLQVVYGYIYYWIKTEDLRFDNSMSKEEKKKAIAQYLSGRAIMPNIPNVINSSSYIPLFVVCLMNFNSLHNNWSKIGIVIFLVLSSALYFTIGRTYYTKKLLSIIVLFVWGATYAVFKFF